jgi:hypothetical protein
MGSINNLDDVTFSGPLTATFSAPTARIPPAPPVEDQVQIASIPTTAEVERLQTMNPSSFQAVVGDAIQKLRAAALRSTDPLEAVYLSGLADRFQRLEEAGEAASPANPAQNLST